MIKSRNEFIIGHYYINNKETAIVQYNGDNSKLLVGSLIKKPSKESFINVGSDNGESAYNKCLNVYENFTDSEKKLKKDIENNMNQITHFVFGNNRMAYDNAWKELNLPKMIFVNGNNMDFYNGPEQKINLGGGKYNDTKYGHELFNFKPINGKYYGFVQNPASISNNKIEIRNIDVNIITDEYGKYIDNVLVILSCTKLGKGKVICGYYNNAKLYEVPFSDKKVLKDLERDFIDKDGNIEIASFNIMCDVENSFLIDQEKRYLSWPREIKQQNIWYNVPIWYKLKVYKYIKSLENNNENDLDIEELDNINDSDLAGFVDNEYKDLNTTDNKNNVIRKDARVSKKALIDQKYTCANCSKSETFTTKKGHQYMEGHHLVRCVVKVAKDIKDTYGKSIDYIENIICLCPECHRKIHYSNDIEKKQMLSKLFNIRKDYLKNIGYDTVEKLYELYEIE